MSDFEDNNNNNNNNNNNYAYDYGYDDYYDDNNSLLDNSNSNELDIEYSVEYDEPQANNIAIYSEEEVNRQMLILEKELSEQFQDLKREQDEELRKKRVELERQIENEKILVRNELQRKQTHLSQVMSDEEDSKRRMQSKMSDLEVKLQVKTGEIKMLRRLKEDLLAVDSISNNANMIIRTELDTVTEKARHLGEEKARVMEDFVEMEKSHSSYVKKCNDFRRDAADYYARIEKYITVLDKVEEQCDSCEMAFEEQRKHSEEVVTEKNRKYEETHKRNQKEVTILGAKVKRIKLELSEIKREIKSKEAENSQLEQLVDELTNMEDS